MHYLPSAALMSVEGRAMDASQTTVSSEDCLRNGFACHGNHQSMVLGERHNGTMCHITRRIFRAGVQL